MGPPLPADGKAGDPSMHSSAGASLSSFPRGCHRHCRGDVTATGTSPPCGILHPAVVLGKCRGTDARASSHFSPPVSRPPHPLIPPALRPLPGTAPCRAGATGEPHRGPEPPEGPGTRPGTSPCAAWPPASRHPAGLHHRGSPRLHSPGVPSTGIPCRGRPRWGFLARVFLRVPRATALLGQPDTPQGQATFAHPSMTGVVAMMRSASSR